MSEVIWRLMWIGTMAAFVAFATFLFFGNVIGVNATNSFRKVMVFDSVRAGEHKLRGVVIVPSACYLLRVKVKESSPELYRIVFETWQEPNVLCPPVPNPRIFETSIFAPALGVSFEATLDGKPLQFHVLESYQ